MARLRAVTGTVPDVLEDAAPRTSGIPNVRHMSKLALQKFLSAPWFTPIWSAIGSDRITIFTLHRFAVPDLGVEGHEPALIRATLGRLRRERYSLISVEDAVNLLQNGGEIPGRAVVFTVDDGYFDFRDVAADLFLEFDCPVTVFLTTGFMDGTSWHWWDHIAYVCRATRVRQIDVALDGAPLRLELGTDSARLKTAQHVALLCTRISEIAKSRFIGALALAADVEIPMKPPAEYRPIGWDDARKLESRGITFGPHTVTHPVLIRTSDDDVVWQLRESWRTIRSELKRPVPVLAYPNGDYGAREIAALSEIGLAGALTTEPAYASIMNSADGAGRVYRIPRFPFPEHAEQACLTASGFTRIAAGVRRIHSAIAS